MQMCDMLKKKTKSSVFKQKFVCVATELHGSDPRILWTLLDRSTQLYPKDKPSFNG